MPEGPEVERVRRTLEPWLVGAGVVGVTLRRRDVVVGEGDPRGGVSRQRAGARGGRADGRQRPIAPAALLVGEVIERVERHGKQLAIVGASGRGLVVHLGMTGRLLAGPWPGGGPALAHTHVVWRLDRGGEPARLRFVDPRRFGGVWVARGREALEAHRRGLGPDGTVVTGDDLSSACGRSARAIKAALLDQGVVAGVGNIYADESLFEAGIGPHRPCRGLTRAEFERLASAVRGTLERAIVAGGSTLRDYVDADGRPGGAQLLHAVYGRGGEACLRCGHSLERGSVAQRTTVWCPRCQG